MHYTKKNAQGFCKSVLDCSRGVCFGTHYINTCGCTVNDTGI